MSIYIYIYIYIYISGGHAGLTRHVRCDDSPLTLSM